MESFPADHKPYRGFTRCHCAQSLLQIANLVQEAAPPTIALACVVLFLKIINIFLKKKVLASYGKLSKKLKKWQKMYLRRAVLELLIQTTF